MQLNANLSFQPSFADLRELERQHGPGFGPALKFIVRNIFSEGMYYAKCGKLIAVKDLGAGVINISVTIPDGVQTTSNGVQTK